jgi:hypothetical protein
MKYDELINNSIINYYRGITLTRNLLTITYDFNINLCNLGKYCAACFREKIIGTEVFDPGILDSKNIIVYRILHHTNSISDVKQYAPTYIEFLIKFKNNGQHKRNS